MNRVGHDHGRPGGKLLAETKRDLKKRGYKSPDVADAMALTFAGGQMGLIHGSAQQRGQFSWHEPITRNRQWV